jgi:trans-aconitate 2-methyltransferase
MNSEGNKNYKWDAAFYAANSNAQLSWASELLEKLNLKGAESLLDIGCGDGKITAEIAYRLQKGNVVGIDSSEEMINFAVNNFPKEKFPNLDFILLDARNLNSEEEFDFIFSNAVLHWIKDHRSLLKAIFNALRPKGRILLQMGGKGNCIDIMKAAGKAMKNPHWKSCFSDFINPYGFYDDIEYKEWLLEAGFIIDKVQLIPKDMQHTGREGLTGWFRSTWLPFIDGVPEHLAEKFINEIFDGYLHDHPIDDDGKTHVKMMRLQVEAHKK